MKKSVAALVYLVVFFELTNGEPVPQKYPMDPPDYQETVVTEKSFLLYTTSIVAHREEDEGEVEEQQHDEDTTESQERSVDTESESRQKEEDAGEQEAHGLHTSEDKEREQEEESKLDAVSGEAMEVTETPTASKDESVEGEMHDGSEAGGGEGVRVTESSIAGASESLEEGLPAESGSAIGGTRSMSVTAGSPLRSVYPSSEIGEFNPATSTFHETVVSEPGFLLYTDDRSSDHAGTTTEAVDLEAASGSLAEDCKSEGDKAGVKSPLSLSISGRIRLICKDGLNRACGDRGER